MIAASPPERAPLRPAETAAADVAPFAVATFDPEGACLEANAAWLRLHGLQPDAVPLQTWCGSVLIADRELARSALADVLRGTRREVTLRSQRPDGAGFAFEATLVPRRGADDAPDGFHAFEHAVQPLDADPEAEGDEQARTPAAGPDVSPGVAARSLGVSISTVRRWIEEGRLEATRTAGGHRRVSEAELRRVGRSANGPPRLRGSRLPEHPIPVLARALLEQGDGLVSGAASRCYVDGAPGWFAQPRARSDLRIWVRRVARAAEAGRPRDAVEATRDMFVQARTVAGLEECQVFADRFSALVLRALTRLDGGPQAATDVSVLLAAMRRTLSSSEDERG
ncbi:MAG: excisionase family DNA-binding protein [Solirubrobacterales bacterium]|nr:excisionase family DNA-binding protein [Solirubrobacterales bacterium]